MPKASQLTKNGKLICSSCKKEKSLSNYHANKANTLGVVGICLKCICEYQKAYKLANKEKLKKYHQKRHIFKKTSNPFKSWAYNVRGSHRERGFKINISIEQLTLKAEKAVDCFLCGKKLNWNPMKKIGDMLTPTLDNINCSKIITDKNSTIVCRRCNITKSDRTMKEFILYCKNILKIHNIT